MNLDKDYLAEPSNAGSFRVCSVFFVVSWAQQSQVWVSCVAACRTMIARSLEFTGQRTPPPLPCYLLNAASLLLQGTYPEAVTAQVVGHALR